ncbi:MAG: hypothetical protein AAB874_07270 [Patescibacteria group bacterium]
MKKDLSVLYLDTTNSKESRVIITVGNIKTEYNEETNQSTKSQNVLILVQKALRDCGLQLHHITAIEVNNGPGSFTGTRVGVTVANALGWVLGKKVNGKQITFPIYSKSKFD